MRGGRGRGEKGRGPRESERGEGEGRGPRESERGEGEGEGEGGGERVRETGVVSEAILCTQVLSSPWLQHSVRVWYR